MAFNVNKVNKRAQKEGVWAPYEGSEFLIASSSNSAYQKRIAALRKPLARQIDKGTVDPDDLVNMLCTGLSEYILLDWKGVVGSDGDVPFSTEAAKDALTDDDDFREFVTEFAATQANFEQEFKEKVVKK